MSGLKSVVLFVVDGMRSDGLRMADTPQMDSMMATGACTLDARSVNPTVTLPCIASMMLGCGPETHGITTNTWGRLDRPVPSVIDVANLAKRTTASLYNWEPLRDLSSPGALDLAVLLRNASDPDGDAEVAAAAAHHLARRQFAFAFVYLGHTDAAGHAHGWMSSEYLKAVGRADAAIRVVVNAVGAAGHGETLFIVSADHGGHDKTHGQDIPEDSIVPWIACGPGATGGKQLLKPVCIIDTAPTVADALGLEIPESWTGKPLL